MRDRKFKAWDKLSKRWVKSYNSSFFPFIWKDNQIVFDEENNPHIELVEYTGLHDKNGKEIYEGDIVKGFLPSNVPGLSRERHGQVIWNEQDASFSVAWFSQGETWIHQNVDEVIGNIYENHKSLNKPCTKVKSGG